MPQLSGLPGSSSELSHLSKSVYVAAACALEEGFLTCTGMLSPVSPMPKRKPRHSPAAIRLATLSIKARRWLGGDRRISQVLWMMAPGIRWTASRRVLALVELLYMLNRRCGVNRLAAGGRGDRARCLETEMLDVVGRCRTRGLGATAEEKAAKTTEPDEDEVGESTESGQGFSTSWGAGGA